MKNAVGHQYRLAPKRGRQSKAVRFGSPIEIAFGGKGIIKILFPAKLPDLSPTRQSAALLPQRDGADRGQSGPQRMRRHGRRGPRRRDRRDRSAYHRRTPEARAARRSAGPPADDGREHTGLPAGMREPESFVRKFPQRPAGLCGQQAFGTAVCIAYEHLARNGQQLLDSLAELSLGPACRAKRARACWFWTPDAWSPMDRREKYYRTQS